MTRRTRAMGIRMALGAAAGAARGLVMREGLAQTTMGIGLGLAGAWWLTRFMSTLLFGVNSHDPWGVRRGCAAAPRLSRRPRATSRRDGRPEWIR